MSATRRGLVSAALTRCGSAACAQYSSPSRLTCTIRCHSSSGASAIGPSSITPALLTSVSSRPEFVDGPGDGGARLRLVGYVGLDDECGAATVADLLREAGEPVGAARGQRDRGALLGEQQRRRLADAAGRARHQAPRFRRASVPL
jgi:hypothetical protein